MATVLLGVAIYGLGQVAVLQSADVAWEQTNGPLGGVVSKMLTVADQPFAALYSGGIYRYTDGQWAQTAIGYGMPENRTFDLVVDPTNHNQLYAGLMIACGATSRDGGHSWAGWCDQMQAQLGYDNFSTDTLLLDPTNPEVIYVAGRDQDAVGHVLRSADQGATWEVLTTFVDIPYFTHMVSFENRLYLGTRAHGIWVSDDSGVTWSEFNSGLASAETIRFAIQEDQQRLFLVSGLFQFNIRQGGDLHVLSEAEWTIPADTRAWREANLDKPRWQWGSEPREQRCDGKIGLDGLPVRKAKSCGHLHFAQGVDPTHEEEEPEDDRRSWEDDDRW